MVLKFSQGFNGVSDPDAATYISAVEAADGELLEFGVGKAINDFILGCKADGIWNAIKASCIMAGARTLAGALVPLKGTAPTNYNFVSGDYNRKTGLVGDGSTKYLDSNRASNADPQNSHHLSIYQTEFDANGNAGSLEGSYVGNDSSFDRIVTGFVSGAQRVFGNSRIGYTDLIAHSAAPGLVAITRNSGSAATIRKNQSNISASLGGPSYLPRSDNAYAYARNPGGNGSPSIYAGGRLAYYSIGESLDLALLDSRVTTLIDTFATTIP